MKFITFYRESNDFTDIVTDKSIKSKIDLKVFWLNYLQIGIENLNDENDTLFSYIELKYGDSIKTRLVPDFSPKPYIDYIPTKR
jgi:hypothetical protein